MKFKRPNGFFDSGPRKWIDKKLPICPLCKKPSLWETATQINFPLPNRLHFRCPNCMATFSASVYIVQKWLGLYSHAAPEIMKIESAGNNLELQHLVGAEYPLEILQKWTNTPSK
jgi:hypothetical protein